MKHMNLLGEYASSISPVACDILDDIKDKLGNEVYEDLLKREN
jgi:hypothetical protein